MRTLFFVAICLILTSCGRVENYQPALRSQPTDAVKFEADRKICIVEAKRRQSAAEPNGIDAGLFGAAGLVFDKTLNSQDDDYHKTPMQMIDECLIKKGYEVIIVDHCC